MEKPITAGIKSKRELIREISNVTGFPGTSIAKVFDAIVVIVREALSNNGPGAISIPGLMTIRVVQKPATKEREWVAPLTGKRVTLKARPEHKSVKLSAARKLKEMVSHNM